jgi:hypothetical protein
MKKLTRNKSSSFIRGIVTIVTMSVLWITMATFSAEAALQGSAGNTIVRNMVTVNYKDNNGTAQTAVTASVDVTVTTVAVAPTVLSFTPSPGSTDGTGATQAYTVRIRTNSNGPGAITFNTADGTFTNIAAGTAPTVPGSIFLGSTVIDPTDSHIGVAQTVANGASITFAVPNDGGVPTDSAVSGGATGDLVINALKVNDIVYIYSGTTYYGPFTVGTVTDPAVGAGTTAAPGSVQLINNTGGSIGPFTPAYGWEILEAKDVTVTVTQGVITTPTLAASWVTTVTAIMGGNNGTGNVTTNAHIGNLTIVKEVSTDGTTWATSGVSVAPAGSLYYRITVSNTGSGAATNVVITDPQPVYTTYLAGSAKRATGAAVSYAAAPTTLTDANPADDGYDFNVTTAKTATYSVGTIATGGVTTAVQLFFRVTVN